MMEKIKQRYTLAGYWEASGIVLETVETDISDAEVSLIVLAQDMVEDEPEEGWWCDTIEAENLFEACYQAMATYEDANFITGLDGAHIIDEERFEELRTLREFNEIIEGFGEAS